VLVLEPVQQLVAVVLKRVLVQAQAPALVVSA
jgi:hypothetical protein